MLHGVRLTTRFLVLFHFYWIVCKAGTLVLRNDSPGFISLESSKRGLTIQYLITDVNICLHTNTI